MIGMPEGVRKLLVAYDVEGYSGRAERLKITTQERLVAVLKYAFTAAHVSPDAYELQEQGDGGLALLPTGDGVDEPRVITTLIGALEAGLADINSDLVPSARIRLRVALDEGVVYRAAHGFAGLAVVHACRLRDADAVRDMLKNSTGNLVVVVADHLYRDVLADARVPGAAFVQAAVTVKELAAMAWVCLPGDPARGQPPGAGRSGVPGTASPAAVTPLEDLLKSDPWLG
jgi:hypothetical protein